MCGIAGWVAFDRDLSEQRDVLQRMTDTMALRGPDAEGLWIGGPAGLGHPASLDHRPRRRSSADGGPRPRSLHRRHLLQRRGLHFEDLRAELRDRGHRFETRSDTEVVLRAYLEWGEGVVERLNGMYAFAIWDVSARTLLSCATGWA